MILSGYNISNHVIAKGGFGEVRLGVHLRTGEKVAAKLLLGRWREHPHHAVHEARFTREGNILHKLSDHPHIVSVLDIGLIAERGGFVPVLIMELCEGSSLDQIVRTAAPLPWTMVADIGRQISAALHSAHTAAVVHRDIKPSNVMFDRSSGLVKVLDFGIARFMEAADAALTHPPTVVTTTSVLPPLTKCYASPEQLRYEDLDGRSDLFSLGAVLFELLTGRLAYRSHRRDRLPVFPDGDGTPDALRALVHQLLAVDLDKRPQSAHEVYRRLTDIRVSAAEARMPEGRPRRPRLLALEAEFAEVIGVVELREGPLHDVCLELREGHAKVAKRAGDPRATELAELVRRDRERVRAGTRHGSRLRHRQDREQEAPEGRSPHAPTPEEIEFYGLIPPPMV
ncbi:serine/threonine-protein kinase [Streptomyces sp. S.PNR 29]|uniref:serine/threonine-protein kinase n=1 Tax=Streptomyces sp. S.PNR 29 TaxID=2973805 RepID=UPI0025AFC9E8|nr:serine/threonine-protein kinase [Streptomyces sp. S.PNR 29]MDN0198286.1 serine/threonine protein kinase [Streptomyces sp. S.PNR 29]